MVAHFVNNGHEVTVISDGPEETYIPLCNEAGYSYRQVPVSRNGMNPLSDYKAFHKIKEILGELKPDRIFCSSAKAVSYGCRAARELGIEHTYAMVTGLGSIFRGRSSKSKLIRIILKRLYKKAFKGCRKVIFHNDDDRQYLVGMHLLPVGKTEVINGSGVDLKCFSASPLPGAKTFLFIGRLLKDKGIREFLVAALAVKKLHSEARFMVVGNTDSNPTSLTQEEIEKYKSDGVIEFYGYQEDVRPYLEQADIFVLPSYHEGRPRCVLEAMAMGRPIITTDAPGCRDTVTEGLNGFLVPVGDASVLIKRMVELLENPELAQKMGKASRRIAEDIYDVNKVNAHIAKIMKLSDGDGSKAGF